MNELQFYNRDDPAHLQGFREIIVNEGGVHPFMDAWWPPGHIIGYEHSFTHIIYELMQGVHTGENPKPNFQDGFRNQQVLDAIQRAGESKRWERV